MHKHAEQWLTILNAIKDELSKDSEKHQKLILGISNLILNCNKYKMEFDFPAPLSTETDLWVNIANGLCKDDVQARKAFSFQLQPLFEFINRKIHHDEKSNQWRRALAGNGFTTPNTQPARQLDDLLQQKQKQLKLVRDQFSSIENSLAHSNDIYALPAHFLIDLFDAFILCDGRYFTQIQVDNYTNLLANMYSEGSMGLYLSVALMQLEHNPMIHHYSHQQKETIKQGNIFMKMYEVDPLLTKLKNGNSLSEKESKEHKSFTTLCKSFIEMKVMVKEFTFIQDKLKSYNPEVKSAPSSDKADKPTVCSIM